MTDHSLQGTPFPWQSASWQQLLAQHQQQRLPHALLLSGHAGTGKRKFALMFASYVLCTEPCEGKACGHCKTCQLLRAGSHPDFMMLEPEEKSRVIKVDQIRGLKNFSAQTAQLSGFKVIIIQPADVLNINAANALLKDLEEPPAKTLFLLISDQPEQISATIRSRCNQLFFATPDRSKAQQWLAQKIPDESAETLALLLTFTDNAPLQALQLHQSDGLTHRKNVYRGFAEVQQGKSHPTSVAQSLQAHEPLDIINWLQIWTADIIKAALTGNAAHFKNQDLAGFLMKTAAQVQLNELYLYLDCLQQKRQALLLGHNPNKILLFESLLISWARCFKR
jgi:DNA polymerase III subunit delta'